MAKRIRTRGVSRKKSMTLPRHPKQHGHPRAWMTILLASAAALIILIMCFAALQIATIAG